MRQIQQTPSAGTCTGLDCQYRWLIYGYHAIYTNVVWVLTGPIVTNLWSLGSVQPAHDRASFTDVLYL